MSIRVSDITSQFEGMAEKPAPKEKWARELLEELTDNMDDIWSTHADRERFKEELLCVVLPFYDKAI